MTLISVTVAKCYVSQTFEVVACLAAEMRY